MPSFTSIDTMLNYLNRNISIVLQDVGKDVEKIIHDYIMKEWYNEHTPHEYIRTYDMINSLRVRKVQKINNGYSIELCFDTDTIHANKVGDSFWNQHMSLYRKDGSGEQNVSQAIPLWIEEGNNPNSKNPVYEYKGIGMMDYASKQKSVILKSLLSHLKSKGFNCKIV